MWLAECAKQAGNWFTFVAAYALIKELSVADVALKTALFLICRRLPYLLLFPVTGLAADRLNRGVLLMVVCLVQGTVSFTLPVVEKRGDIWLLYPLILIQYSAQAFYDPARISAIPTIIPAQLLCVAGTLDLLGFSLMALLGAAVAGRTAAVYGTATCFRIEGVTFVAAAALMLRLARRRYPVSEAAKRPAPRRVCSKAVHATYLAIDQQTAVPADAEAEAASSSPSANCLAAKLLPDSDFEASHAAACSGLRPLRQSSLSAPADTAAVEPPPTLQPLLAELLPPRPATQPAATTTQVAVAAGALRPPHALADDELGGHGMAAGSGSRRAGAFPGHCPGSTGCTNQQSDRSVRSDGGSEDGASSEGYGDQGGGGRGTEAGGCGGCGALRFLARRRNWDVAALIWVKATGAMAWGAADVLNGRFSQTPSMQTLGGSDVTLGLILVSVGLGSILGPFVANGFTPGVARYWRVSIAAAFLLLGSGYALMAAARSVAYVLPATIVRTAGSATIWVHSLAIMQHRLHEGIRGRLVALEFVLYTVSEAASTLFGGYALDSLGWSPRRLCLTLAGMGAAFSVAWSLYAWGMWDGPSTYLDEENRVREPLLQAEEGTGDDGDVLKAPPLGCASGI